MPQKGEQRTAGGESRQWSGTRWEPVAEAKQQSVDNPVSFGWLDAVPGLRDALNIPVNAVKGAQALPDVVRGLVHEPSATLKGFAQGSSEAATPERLGLLALLTGGATLPAALAAAGGEGVAQATRYATNAPNAPQSFPEAVGNVAEAASVPALAGAVKAVPGAVERLGGTRKLASRALGASYGGYEGYQHGGVGGMIGGAVAGGAAGDVLGGGSRTMRGLRMIMGGGAADEAAAATAAPKPAAPVEAPVAKPDVNWSGVTLSPEAAARNVEATNLRDVSGYGHDVAGKLAGIPGAGKARVTNIPMGEHAITDEMIQNAGGTVTPAPKVSPSSTAMTADVQPTERIIEDAERVPRQEPVEPSQGQSESSVSMRGLEQALGKQQLPSSWMKMPSDAEMEADILDRRAAGRWKR